MDICLENVTNQKNAPILSEMINTLWSIIMAKIVEDVIVIKFSSLVKDGAAEQTTCITEEIQAALEQVAQELVGQHVVVEVVTA